MLNLWNWQVFLSGMCPEEDAAAGTVAKFEGELCTGDEARRNAEHMMRCPDYRDKCKSTPRCEPWECANSLPCTLKPEAGGPDPDTKGMCEEEVTFTIRTGVEKEKEKVCRSIWCDEKWEFLPAVLAGSLAFLILLSPWISEPLKGLLPKRLRRGPFAEAKVAAADAAKAISADAWKASGVDSGKVSGADAAKASGADAASSSDVAKVSKAVAAEAESTPKRSAEASSPLEIPDERMIQIGSSTPQQADEETDLQFDSERVEVEVPALPFLLGGKTATSEAIVKKPDSEAMAAPAIKEENKSAQAVPSRPKAGDKFPLGLARFLASTHVVIGHLYAKGITPKVYFFGWGFTWVPWFFMLSGFVLFTAHLRRPKEEGILDYALRRSVGIYPLYALSLIPAIVIAKALGSVPSVQVLIAQSFLVQAWWPGWTEQALQTHCWFLSAMVVFWLLFKPLSRCLQNLSLVATLASMVALFALPWLVILVPAIAHQSLTWYSAHSWGQTSTLLDLSVVFLKFHPACYLHIFVLGMLLAKLRILLDAKAKTSARPWVFCLPMEFLAPIGYLGLFLVFSLPELEPLAFKLSARLSVLLPFQAAVLLGLAGLPSMPIGRVAQFATWFNFLENYSYAMYVFQFICYSVWPDRGQINLALFLIFSMGSAVVIATVVQKPVQGWWSKYPTGRLAVPFVLSAVLVGVAMLPVHDPNPDVPIVVRHDSRMFDTRLPLVDSEGSAMGLLMNPSLAVQGDRIVMTARRHKLEVSWRNGWYNHSSALVEDQTWHSDILLGEVALDAEAWSRWPTTGEAPFQASMKPWYWLRTPQNQGWRHLCAPEDYVVRNNTLVRHVVTGPEDAKVFLRNGSISVSFNSLPPMGEEGCALGQDVSQMYLASSVSADGAADSVGRHLTCGATDKAEKNWIPFEHNGKMYFVYSPSPHRVVRAEDDGSCQQVFSTDFEPFAKLKRNNSHLEIRGSGQAVFVNDTAATPSLPRPHFLAALHIYDTKAKTYSHFAYRFSDEPPFNILQVSSQLPLVEATSEDSPTNPFAFVSGLAVVNRTVAISYGAGDREARALVMTMDRLDELFACADAMGGEAVVSGNASFVGNGSVVGNTSATDNVSTAAAR